MIDSDAVLKIQILKFQSTHTHLKQQPEILESQYDQFWKHTINEIRTIR